MSPPKLFKRLIIFWAVTAAVWWVQPSWAGTLSSGEARINYQEGEVLLKNTETEDWVEVSKHLPVKAEDNLWVAGGGRAEIKFSEGSYARLAENTALEIGKLERTDEGARTELTLTEGLATFVVRTPYKGGLEFLVDTPSLTVRAPEEATFRLEVDNQGATTLAVHKGTVEATSSEGTVSLGRGQAARFAEGKMSYQEYYAKDAWDHWNDRRDATYASAKSRKYLPPSLASEASDFDRNGTWVSTPEYGFVWVPRVAAGWTPYNNGQWVYVGSGPDPVWIPEEPWGWAPFHYGRWAYLDLGWAWVPPLPPLPFPFWVPAAVAWFTIDSLFAWVPLAPFEPFFAWHVWGPGCFLFSDPFFHVHVVNIFVFKHVHIHRAVVALHRGFLFAPHRQKVIVSNALLKSGKVKPGAAKLGATKAAFNPRPDKAVSRKALPSKEVMQKASLAKSKGLERVGKAQRQEALASAKAREKTLEKGVTAPKSRGEGIKPGVKSRTETPKPLRDNQVNRARSTPSLDRTPKALRDLKGDQGLRTQERRTLSTPPPGAPRTGERTVTTPRVPRADNRPAFQQPRVPAERFQRATPPRIDNRPQPQMRGNVGGSFKPFTGSGFNRGGSSFAPRTQAPAFSAPRGSAPRGGGSALRGQRQSF